MRPSSEFIRGLRTTLPRSTADHLDRAVRAIVAAKKRGGSVVVITGSGPNVHEGVTTLLAEMIRKGIVDGVITSSAVVAHEMAGTLDRVKRVHAPGLLALPIPWDVLPRGGTFEITMLAPEELAEMEREVPDGWEIYRQVAAAPGSVILKAAGNMAFPMGLRTERLAHEICEVARACSVPFERIAGAGADPRTMIGAGAALDVPVLVSIPQLVGGGAVGLSIADSISIHARSTMIAQLLARADVLIESAIALSQEIHDGPFETYTGHGIWAAWDGCETYSLQGKTLVRIDLDPNLERAWTMERSDAEVQAAVDQGLPKTKRTGIPFRMEMSGFARLESSIPVTADIGVAWPVLAQAVEAELGTKLDFISAPQESEEGRRMRDWIADEIRYLDRDRALAQPAPKDWLTA